MGPVGDFQRGPFFLLFNKRFLFLETKENIVATQHTTHAILKKIKNKKRILDFF